MKELLRSLTTGPRNKVIMYEQLKAHIPSIVVLRHVLNKKDLGCLTKTLNKFKVKNGDVEKVISITDAVDIYYSNNENAPIDNIFCFNNRLGTMPFKEPLIEAIFRDNDEIDFLATICRYKESNIANVNTEENLVFKNKRMQKPSLVLIPADCVKKNDNYIVVDAITTKILYQAFRTILSPYYGTKKINKMFKKMINIFNIKDSRVIINNNSFSNTALVINKEAAGEVPEDFIFVDDNNVPLHTSTGTTDDASIKHLRNIINHVQKAEGLDRNKEAFIEFNMKTFSLKLV